MPEDEMPQVRTTEEINRVLRHFNRRLRDIEGPYQETLEQNFQSIEDSLVEYQNMLLGVEASLESQRATSEEPTRFQNYINTAKKIGMGIVAILALYGGCSLSSNLKGCFYDNGIEDVVQDLKEQQTRKMTDKLRAFYNSPTNPNNPQGN